MFVGETPEYITMYTELHKRFTKIIQDNKLVNGGYYWIKFKTRGPWLLSQCRIGIETANYPTKGCIYCVDFNILNSDCPAEFDKIILGDKIQITYPE